MKLYRPVGLYEMSKILDCKGKAFPPRMAEQPIFYPVLNPQYASQIAEKWNTKDSRSGFAGYVTEFEVNDEFISQYQPQQVGGELHMEYWIPATKLDDFNENIIGDINIIDAFFGTEFTGIKPEGMSGFREEVPLQQLQILAHALRDNYLDFSGTVCTEWKLVNLNFLMWLQTGMFEDVLKEMLACLKRNNRNFIKTPEW